MDLPSNSTYEPKGFGKSPAEGKDVYVPPSLPSSQQKAMQDMALKRKSFAQPTQPTTTPAPKTFAEGYRLPQRIIGTTTTDPLRAAGLARLEETVAAQPGGQLPINTRALEPETRAPQALPPDYTGFRKATLEPGDTAVYPKAPEIRNLAGGQYVADIAQPEALVKSIRGDNSEIKKILLGDRPSWLYQVDHVIPLHAGGTDAVENLEVLTIPDHDRKTRVQSVFYTLYRAGEMTKDQMRVNSVNWRSYDDSIVPKPDFSGDLGGVGLLDVNKARKIANSWKEVKSVTAADVKAAIPDVMKTVGEGWMPKPVRAAVQGFVSEGTMGYVPNYMAEDATFEERAGNIAGSALGMIGSFVAVSAATEGLGGVAMIGARALPAGKKYLAAAEGARAISKIPQFQKAVNTIVSTPGMAWATPRLARAFDPLAKTIRDPRFRWLGMEFNKLTVPMAIGAGAKMVEYGLLSDTVRRHYALDVQSGDVPETYATDKELAANILTNTAMGVGMGFMPPTLKGSVQTAGALGALQLIEDPSKPEDALVTALAFGLLHATGIPEGTRVYETQRAQANNLVGVGSWEAVRDLVPNMKNMRTANRPLTEEEWDSLLNVYIPKAKETIKWVESPVGGDITKTTYFKGQKSPAVTYRRDSVDPYGQGALERDRLAFIEVLAKAHLRAFRGGPTPDIWTTESPTGPSAKTMKMAEKGKIKISPEEAAKKAFDVDFLATVGSYAKNYDVLGPTARDLSKYEKITLSLKENVDSLKKLYSDKANELSDAERKALKIEELDDADIENFFGQKSIVSAPPNTAESKALLDTRAKVAMGIKMTGDPDYQGPFYSNKLIYDRVKDDSPTTSKILQADPGAIRVRAIELDKNGVPTGNYPQIGWAASTDKLFGKNGTREAPEKGSANYFAFEKGTVEEGTFEPKVDKNVLGEEVERDVYQADSQTLARIMDAKNWDHMLAEVDKTRLTISDKKKWANIPVEFTERSAFETAKMMDATDQFGKMREGMEGKDPLSVLVNRIRKGKAEIKDAAVEKTVTFFQENVGGSWKGVPRKGEKEPQIDTEVGRVYHTLKNTLQIGEQVLAQPDLKSMVKMFSELFAVRRPKVASFENLFLNREKITNEEFLHFVEDAGGPVSKILKAMDFEKYLKQVSYANVGDKRAQTYATLYGKMRVLGSEARREEDQLMKKPAPAEQKTTDVLEEPAAAPSKDELTQELQDQMQSDMEAAETPAATKEKTVPPKKTVPAEKPKAEAKPKTERKIKPLSEQEKRDQAEQAAALSRSVRTEKDWMDMYRDLVVKSAEVSGREMSDKAIEDKARSLFLIGESMGSHPLFTVRAREMLKQTKGSFLFEQKGIDAEGKEYVKSQLLITKNGEAIISVLKNPDYSTAIHEIAHITRNNLFSRTKADGTKLKPEDRFGITDEDIKIAEDYSGAKDGKWTKDAEEKWANAFEKYLAEDTIPNEKMRPLFEKIKKWMRAIYDTFVGTTLEKTEISPEMRGVFDRLLKREGREAPPLKKPEPPTGGKPKVESRPAEIETLWRSRDTNPEGLPLQAVSLIREGKSESGRSEVISLSMSSEGSKKFETREVLRRISALFDAQAAKDPKSVITFDKAYAFLKKELEKRGDPRNWEMEDVAKEEFPGTDKWLYRGELEATSRFMLNEQTKKFERISDEEWNKKVQRATPRVERINKRIEKADGVISFGSKYGARAIFSKRAKDAGINLNPDTFEKGKIYTPILDPKVPQKLFDRPDKRVVFKDNKKLQDSLKKLVESEAFVSMPSAEAISLEHGFLVEYRKVGEFLKKNGYLPEVDDRIPLSEIWKPKELVKIKEEAKEAKKEKKEKESVSTAEEDTSSLEETQDNLTGDNLGQVTPASISDSGRTSLLNYWREKIATEVDGKKRDKYQKKFEQTVLKAKATEFTAKNKTNSFVSAVLGEDAAQKFTKEFTRDLAHKATWGTGKKVYDPEIIESGGNKFVSFFKAEMKNSVSEGEYEKAMGDLFGKKGDNDPRFIKKALSLYDSMHQVEHNALTLHDSTDTPGAPLRISITPSITDAVKWNEVELNRRARKLMPALEGKEDLKFISIDKDIVDMLQGKGKARINKKPVERKDLVNAVRDLLWRNDRPAVLFTRSGKGADNLHAVFYEPEYVNYFDRAYKKDPSKFLAPGETVESWPKETRDRTKFLRVLMHLQGLPPDPSLTAASDFTSKGNLYQDSYHLVIHPNGVPKEIREKGIKVHLLSTKKISDVVDKMDIPKEADYLGTNDAEKRKAIKSLVGLDSQDGETFFMPKLYNNWIAGGLNIEKLGSDTSLKALVTKMVEGQDTLILKGYHTRMDAAHMEMIKEIYKLAKEDIGEYDIVAFDSNVKAGKSYLKEGRGETYVPWYGIRFKNVGRGTEGRITPGMRSKMTGEELGAGGKRALQIEKAKAKEVTEWINQFQKDLHNAQTSEELINVFEERGVDPDTALYGELLRSKELGGSAKTFRKQIDNYIKGLRIDESLTSSKKGTQMFSLTDGTAKLLTYNTKGEIVKRESLKRDEIVLSEADMKNLGVSEGQYVIVSREPSLSPYNLAYLRVVNGSKRGYDSLDGQAAVHLWVERLVLRGDKDGDQIRVSRVEDPQAEKRVLTEEDPDWVPNPFPGNTTDYDYHYVNLVKNAKGKLIVSPEPKKDPAKAVTYESVMEGLNNQHEGDILTETTSIANHLAPALHQYGAEVEIKKKGESLEVKFMVTNSKGKKVDITPEEMKTFVLPPGALDGYKGGKYKADLTEDVISEIIRLDDYAVDSKKNTLFRDITHGDPLYAYSLLYKKITGDNVSIKGQSHLNAVFEKLSKLFQPSYTAKKRLESTEYTDLESLFSREEFSQNAILLQKLKDNGFNLRPHDEIFLDLSSVEDYHPMGIKRKVVDEETGEVSYKSDPELNREIAELRDVPSYREAADYLFSQAESVNLREEDVYGNEKAIAFLEEVFRLKSDAAKASAINEVYAIKNGKVRDEYSGSMRRPQMFTEVEKDAYWKKVEELYAEKVKNKEFDKETLDVLSVLAASDKNMNWGQGMIDGNEQFIDARYGRMVYEGAFERIKEEMVASLPKERTLTSAELKKVKERAIKEAVKTIEDAELYNSYGDPHYVRLFEGIINGSPEIANEWRRTYEKAEPDVEEILALKAEAASSKKGTKRSTPSYYRDFLGRTLDEGEGAGVERAPRADPELRRLEEEQRAQIEAEKEAEQKIATPREVSFAKKVVKAKAKKTAKELMKKPAEPKQLSMEDLLDKQKGRTSKGPADGAGGPGLHNLRAALAKPPILGFNNLLNRRK